MSRIQFVKAQLISPNVCKPSDNLKFELTLDNQKYLKDDITFEVSYMGDAYNDKRDQIICENVIGPIEQGKFAFQLETSPIDLTKIPIKTLFGLTTVLIVGKFKGQIFVRIGYVVDMKHNGVDSEKLVDQDPISENDELGEDDESTEVSEECSEEICCDDGEEDCECPDEEEESASGTEEGSESLDEEEESASGTEEESESLDEEEENASCSKEGSESLDEEEESECCSKEECNCEEAFAKGLENMLANALLPKNRKEIPLETPIVSEKDDFEYNGFDLKQSKIEMHFLDKPIIHVFEIDWTGEAEQKENIAESSESNDETAKKIKTE